MQSSTTPSQSPVKPANIRNESTTDSCQQRQHDQDNESSPSSTNLESWLLAVHGMDFSQLELRYRAEGNANLVLAMPQFKKVLRLPKMSINNQQKQQQEQEQNQSTSGAMELQNKPTQPLKDPKEEYLQNVLASIGDLKMADYVGYIDIVRALLGDEFIFKTQIIKIASVKQRMWINETIRKYRPAQRLDKEFRGQFGLVLPDATLLPESDILLSNLQATPTSTCGETYAIEIKPKQGWWLQPGDVNDLFHVKTLCAEVRAEQAATTTAAPTTVTKPRTCKTTATCTMERKMASRCRYCAMQFLKLKNCKISKLGSYCPMELFSGESSRMLLALGALLECPQNNLRIFCNGNLIYGDHSTSMSWQEVQQQIFKGDMLQIVQQLLVTCLLRDFEAARDAKSGATVVRAVAGQPLSSTFRDTTKMAKKPELQAVQETMQDQVERKKKKLELTIPTTVAAASKKANRAQINEAELGCLPKNCVLQKVLHLQLLAKRNINYMSSSEFSNASTKNYTILRGLLNSNDSAIGCEQLQPVQQYLLGATALDCSIMIAFQEVVTNECLPSNSHLVHLKDYNRCFLTKVTILDLDPKPDSHYCKYICKTVEAYECCEESMATTADI